MWIQPTFFVSQTGNDNDSGLTQDHAIQTTDELCRRLMAGIFNQNVTVTFGPGTFGNIDLPNLICPKVLTLVGDVSSSPSQTLSGVTVQSAVSATRGAISSGSFTLFQRLRMIDGAAAGCLDYVTAVPSPGNANNTRFRKYNTDITGLLSSSLVLLNPNVGDSFVGDTLNTTLGLVTANLVGGGRLSIRDFNVMTPAGTNPSHRLAADFTDAINGVWFEGCEFSSPNGFYTFQESECGFAICKFRQFPIFEDSQVSFHGCFFPQAFPSFGFQSFGSFEDTAAFIGTGAGVRTNQGSIIQFTGDNNTGDFSWFDGTSGNALETRLGGIAAARLSARLWGAGTYSNTFLIQSLSNMSYLLKPSITGGVHDALVGTQSKMYADLPFVDPTTNSGFVHGTI